MINNNDFKRVFSIDIGTNSIHGIIADLDSNRRIREYYRDKESIRLGANIIDGKITDYGIHLAIEVLQRFKKQTDKFDATIRAVATSAVRESTNNNAFKDSILNETGISIEILSCYDEGLYISKGVVNGLELFNKNLLIIDIGGGSTELIYCSYGQVFVESLKIGAIRSTINFFGDKCINMEKIQAFKSYIAHEIEKFKIFISEKKIDNVVGTSGTIQTIGKIILGLDGILIPAFIQKQLFSINKLRNSINVVLDRKSIDERIGINGLDSSRDDIIFAGSIILSEILDQLCIKDMIISTYSLREGIIFDTFEQMKNVNYKN